MTYGRPSMIFSAVSSSRILPRIPSTASEASAGQSVDTADQTAFYPNILELHEIVGDILTAFHERPAAHSSGPSLNVPGLSPRASVFKAPFLIQRISTGDFQSLLKFDVALLN
jgi:hypothetical protein